MNKTEEFAAVPAHRPSVGRTVHYQAFGTPGGEFPSVARAAIITAVVDEPTGLVDLAVLNPTGLFFNRCPFSTTPRAGHWNWPPRTS